MELKKYNFFSEYSIGMQIFLGTNNVVKYCNAIGLTGKLYCSIEQARLLIFCNDNYHLFIIKNNTLKMQIKDTSFITPNNIIVAYISRIMLNLCTLISFVMLLQRYYYP